ncbi:MAG: NfeD family protein [Acidobacteriota bacterium]
MLSPAGRRHARIFLAMLAASLVAALVGLPAWAAAPGAGEVVVLPLRSLIHPVAAEYIVDALADADSSGAAAVVIELDTPGGSLESTHEICRAILNARTPVVVYVAPSGARAASAGFFLLMAADVAAMAPETNTGAAHPVGGAGETIEGVLGEKVEQDAAATIRHLAGRNHRDTALAEAAVRKSRSFTDAEALKAGLVDVVAPDLQTLVRDLDGREIAKSDGAQVRLHTAGAVVREVKMGPVRLLLSAICHPNVAYLLMTLGFLGIYFEFSHPGAVLPGVVGAIALVLGLYALSVLQANYAGIGLIFLGLCFFIAEIKITSYGLLTVGGIVSLVLGSLMLFKSAEPALRVSRDVIGAVATFTVLVAAFLLTMVARARRRPVRTGAEGLLLERGMARSPLAPHGKVFVHGELWEAVAEAPVAEGAAVEIVAVEGSVLRVRPWSPPGRSV